MNEEWFGIMAKGPAPPGGVNELYPRAAYYVIKEAHRFDPYAQDASLETLEQFFGSISLEDAYDRAKIGINEEDPSNDHNPGS